MSSHTKMCRVCTSMHSKRGSGKLQGRAGANVAPPLCPIRHQLALLPLDHALPVAVQLLTHGAVAVKHSSLQAKVPSKLLGL